MCIGNPFFFKVILHFMALNTKAICFLSIFYDVNGFVIWSAKASIEKASPNETVAKQAMVTLQGMAEHRFKLYFIIKVLLYCGIYKSAFSPFSPLFSLWPGHGNHVKNGGFKSTNVMLGINSIQLTSLKTCLLFSDL